MDENEVELLVFDERIVENGCWLMVGCCKWMKEEKSEEVGGASIIRGAA